MISVAICGSIPIELGLVDSVTRVEIQGVPIPFGRVESLEPEFNPQDSDCRRMVLIRTRAFSCNYRDKALIHYFAQNVGSSLFSYVGSEFVGEVVEVGAEVTGFRPGDRVMANNQYPDSGVKGLLAGVTANSASQRIWAVHEAKIIKVPTEMPDEIAAGFSIGAQTSYGMLRRLDLCDGAVVLVTAARSNTSLFVINALRKRNVQVYAATTSTGLDTLYKEMGIKCLIHVDADARSFLEYEEIRQVMKEAGGFDAVIDPFYDLHLGKVMDAIALNGKYITCGKYNQFQNQPGQEAQNVGRDFLFVMDHAMNNNIEIIGNCLGSREDLENAIVDYVSGILHVVTDSTFRGAQIGEFFERTYNVKERLGKVIYFYDNISSL